MRRHQPFTAQAYVQRQRVPRHGPSVAQRQNRHLVIFDWDDTLFPTTHFLNNFKAAAGFYHKEKRARSAATKDITAQDLHRFAKSTYYVMRQYIAVFGAHSIFIVTNAMKGWVMHSLTAMSAIYRQSDSCDIGLDFFALIKELLLTANVPVISAQYLHARRYPQQPTMWKIFTFKHLAKRHFRLSSRLSSKGAAYVLLSIGDSVSEYVAAFETKRMLETDNRMNRNDDKFQLLRVKLKTSPSIEHMILQNEHLYKIAKKIAPKRANQSNPLNQSQRKE